MEFSQKTISELQQILIETYGEQYSVQEATAILSKLVSLYDEIIQINYKEDR